MRSVQEESFGRKVDNLRGTINLTLPVSWQLISTFLASIILIAALFLLTASYSKSENAAGSVIPEGGILEVVPPRPGRVEAVLVKEGQLVRSGTPLARIRVEETDRSGAGAQAAILAAIDRQDQSLAEQEAMRRSAALSEQSQYKMRIEGLRDELATIQSQIEAQELLVSMASVELERTSEVAQRGFISRRDIVAREESVLARRQQLASLNQNRAAKIASLREATSAQQQAMARSAASAAELTGSRAQIERERAAASAEQGYTLVAPAEGRVAALALHPGDAVGAEETAMMIVPAGGGLVARVYVPGKAAGFVRPGQEIRLAFDAYPFDRFGTVDGRITSLSSAPVSRTDANGSTAPFYVATAQIPRPMIEAYGERRPLLAGMTFKARIVTERRSLVEWLFDPLFAAVPQ